MESVKVFDTWVEAGGRMHHFDVMTRDEATALKLANEHMAAMGLAAAVTTQECQFCHQEPLAYFSEAQQRMFRESGGFIVTLSE